MENFDAEEYFDLCDLKGEESKFEDLDTDMVMSLCIYMANISIKVFTEKLNSLDQQNQLNPSVDEAIRQFIKNIVFAIELMEDLDFEDWEGILEYYGLDDLVL